MTVNASQITPERIDPAAIYELASIGLTTKGICASYSMDPRTMLFHFGKTIEKGRAHRAAKLLRVSANRAEWVDPDEKTLGGPDQAAVALMLRRCDPEPKEAQIIVAPMMLPTNTNFSLPDLNDLELPS